MNGVLFIAVLALSFPFSSQAARVTHVQKSVTQDALGTFEVEFLYLSNGYVDVSIRPLRLERGVVDVQVMFGRKNPEREIVEAADHVPVRVGRRSFVGSFSSRDVSTVFAVAMVRGGRLAHTFTAATRLVSQRKSPRWFAGNDAWITGPKNGFQAGNELIVGAMGPLSKTGVEPVLAAPESSSASAQAVASPSH